MLPPVSALTRDTLLRGVYFLLPVLALMAPLGMVPLAVLMAVCLVLTTRRPWVWPPPSLSALVVLPPLFAALSALWSLDPILSLKAAGQIAALAVLALLLAIAALTDDIAAAAPAALAGVAVVTVLLLLDRVLDSRLIGLVHQMNMTQQGWEVYAQASTKRGTSVIAVMAWPLAGALFAAGRVRLALLALALSGGAVLIGYSTTAQLTFAVGLPAWLLFRFGRRRMVAALVALLVVLVAAAPWAARQLPPPQILWDAQPWIPNSAHHRLTIWHFVADKVAERPLLGWGMDSSRVMPGSEVTIGVTRTVDGHSAFMYEQMLPLHPHNTALQWWLELGGIGTGLMVALTAALALAASRLAASQAAFALAGLAAALVCAASAFGAWQSWWLSSLAMIVPLVVTVSHKKVAQ